jgi:hypothetical protein
MKCFSKAEFQRSLENSTIDAYFEDAGLSEGRVPLGFSIPGDAGRRGALATRLANLILDEHEQCYLWIKGTDVWASASHPDIFESYRRAHGEDRSVKEAPIHLFLAGEQVQLASVLAIGLYFFWDMELASDDLTLGLSISHDEWMEARVADTKVEARLLQYIGLVRLLKS